MLWVLKEPDKKDKRIRISIQPAGLEWSFSYEKDIENLLIKKTPTIVTLCFQSPFQRYLLK